MKRRGRPPLGQTAETGASRQRRSRIKRGATAVRLETWVTRDVALFFRRAALEQGIPLHRAVAAKLEAAASDGQQKRLEEQLT